MGSMKAKKRKRRKKAWAEFQAVHSVSDETMALVRKVHGRVAELMRSFPDPPPDQVEEPSIAKPTVESLGEGLDSHAVREAIRRG